MVKNNMSFHTSGNKKAISILKSLSVLKGQNRAVLLLGNKGWGKTSTALDFATNILQTSPLDSSDIFIFRNDDYSLKTEFFIKNHPNSSYYNTWLKLLLRRLNMSTLIEETLSLPSGIKLISIKEELQEYINYSIIPDEKHIQKLLNLTAILDKKNGIPINIIRELNKFHSIKSNKGRVSILSDFHMADETTQNATLKLLEEPHKNHWIILTATNTQSIISTILSRTLKIDFQKPLSNDLKYLGDSKNSTSSIDIMMESIYKISATKLQLINEFFNTCTNSIESSINFLQFSEKLQKDNYFLLFLEELILCFQDTLRLRQNILRPTFSIPIKYPQYQEFSNNFVKATTYDLEELVHSIETTKNLLKRSVLRADFLLPSLFLEIARMLRRLK